MEFDKTKILTCVTADQAKVGMNGWVADTLSVLMRRVKECHPTTIAVITGESMEKRFVSDANAYALFYPAPKTTYRPFRNAEEFKPFRDRWVLYGGKTTKINSYSGFGVSVGLSESMYNWVLALEMIRFEDGTPFGMEVTDAKN